MFFSVPGVLMTTDLTPSSPTPHDEALGNILQKPGKVGHSGALTPPLHRDTENFTRQTDFLRPRLLHFFRKSLFCVGNLYKLNRIPATAIAAFRKSAKVEETFPDNDPGDVSN
jgi:hypothetical protein